MTTITPNYTQSTITITDWSTSLGADEFAVSATLDISGTKFLNVQVGGVINTGASATTGEFCSIFVLANYDTVTSTSFTGAIGTSYVADDELLDGTAVELENMDLIKVVRTDQASKLFHWGPVGLAQFFSGDMPQKIAIGLKNETSGVLGSSSTLYYTGITLDNS